MTVRQGQFGQLAHWPAGRGTATVAERAVGEYPPRLLKCRIVLLHYISEHARLEGNVWKCVCVCVQIVASPTYGQDTGVIC